MSTIDEAGDPVALATQRLTDAIRRATRHQREDAEEVTAAREALAEARRAVEGSTY